MVVVSELAVVCRHCGATIGVACKMNPDQQQAIDGSPKPNVDSEALAQWKRGIHYARHDAWLGAGRPTYQLISSAIPTADPTYDYDTRLIAELNDWQ